MGEVELKKLKKNNPRIRRSYFYYRAFPPLPRGAIHIKTARPVVSQGSRADHSRATEGLECSRDVQNVFARPATLCRPGTDLGRRGSPRLPAGRRMQPDSQNADPASAPRQVTWRPRVPQGSASVNERGSAPVRSPGVAGPSDRGVVPEASQHCADRRRRAQHTPSACFAETTAECAIDRSKIRARGLGGGQQTPSRS